MRGQTSHLFLRGEDGWYQVSGTLCTQITFFSVENLYICSYVPGTYQQPWLYTYRIICKVQPKSCTCQNLSRCHYQYKNTILKKNTAIYTLHIYVTVHQLSSLVSVVSGTSSARSGRAHKGKQSRPHSAP